MVTLLVKNRCLYCYFMEQCYTAARPVILEPVMLVELKAPIEFQGTVTGDINKYVFLVYFFLA